MARLVVYGSSLPCPDMRRFERWLERFEVDGMVMLDIHRDPTARARLLSWVGHASVPTLVIAADDGLVPVDPPAPIEGRRTRALDRGTLISEPSATQIEAFLTRHEISVRDRYAENAGAPAR